MTLERLQEINARLGLGLGSLPTAEALRAEISDRELNLLSLLALLTISAGGTGTVTSASIVTANGVSGTTANATSTPAHTIVLGAITPSSVTFIGPNNRDPSTNISATNQFGQPTFGLNSVAGLFTDSAAIDYTNHVVLLGHLAEATEAGYWLQWESQFQLNNVTGAANRVSEFHLVFTDTDANQYRPLTVYNYHDGHGSSVGLQGSLYGSSHDQTRLWESDKATPFLVRDNAGTAVFQINGTTGVCTISLCVGLTAPTGNPLTLATAAAGGDHILLSPSASTASGQVLLVKNGAYNAVALAFQNDVSSGLYYETGTNRVGLTINNPTTGRLMILGSGHADLVKLQSGIGVETIAADGYTFAPGTDLTAAPDAGVHRAGAASIKPTNGSTGYGNFEMASGVTWRSGSGTPEGSVTGAVGSLYTRTDGGANTSIYVKESGAGNTGWIAK